MQLFFDSLIAPLRQAIRLLVVAVPIVATNAPAFATAPEDAVFRMVLRKPGDDGSKAYRIPGLATTPRGTLLAVFDIRHDGPGDLPGNVDVGLMRSTDHGDSWNPMQRILDFDKDEPNSHGNGVGDPAILVDRETGAAFVAALWSQGNRGWAGSGPGMKPAETGQLVITKSTDDGVAWSEPLNITSQVKDPRWRLCFQGPGAGIQTKDGTLIFAAQYRDAEGPPHSCFIYSRDHGETWTISPPAIPGAPPTSEAQIAELADGSLLLTMRNESRAGQRIWARWTWSDTSDEKTIAADGKSPMSGEWSEPWLELPDPTCMASLISHPEGPLLFANPASSNKRVALTIRASDDGGRTWSSGRVLDAGPSMYSCMTILSDGRVGILYEAKNTLVFARFPLSWIVENQDLSLALPFSDHMVLQSGAKTTVWGRTRPKAEVAVSFASQVKKTRANDYGEWRVKLDPLAVNDAPQELRVSSGREEAVCRDVLVGEVWLCAGQSNMEWPLAAEAHADRETPLANRPGIRLLNLAYAGQGYFAKPFDDAVLARLTPDEFYEGRWRKCTPRSAAKFSAVGYYFAKELDDAVDPPIGVINLAVGGSPAEAWVRRDALAAAAELGAMLKGNWLENDALDSWCRRRGVENLGDALAADQDLATDDSGPNHPFKPGFLWDAGMAELAPFPIRGVLWYQGESNALERWRIPQHEPLFRLLVDDWRQQWGQGDFPFLYCQLSSIGTEQGYQSHYWPEFRDSQRRMLRAIPNAGMAVTSDLGHPTDVHPRNKREVGRRLALWALRLCYEKTLSYSGPLARSVRREGAALVVEFDHADGGLRTADGLDVRGFEIAGDDGAFQPALALVTDETVTLSSSHVAAPVSARYGWQPYAIGNLTNNAGLPASTFSESTHR